jgi:hypothetical protein
MRLGFRRSERTMLRRRFQIPLLETRDERGRKVPLFMPEVSAVLRGTPPGFSEDEFRRIRRRIVGPDNAWGVTTGMMVLFAVILAVLLVFRLSGALFFGSSWWPVAKTAAWLVIVAVAAELMLRGYGWRGRWWWMGQRKSAEAWTGRVRASFLAERRCPSCSYPLGELVEEGDGCTVCPECGAAWKVGGS